MRDTVDWLLATQTTNGNWPSSSGWIGKDRGENELVHWCHGAPGVVHLMALAYINYGDDKYLQARYFENMNLPLHCAFAGLSKRR